MSSFLIYLLFATIPFWHVIPFGHVSVYEISILLNILFIPAYLGKGGLKWKQMDTFVFLFAFYGIVTVAISSSTMYESMRIYRYMVLGPVLIYFILRMMQLNQKQISKGLMIFSVCVSVQSLSVIYYVLVYGERPANDIAWQAYQYHDVVAPIVTYSVLAVMSASASFFLAGQFKGKKRYALLLVGFICAGGLLASATRASVIGFLLLFPISGWVLRRRIRRKLLVAGGYSVFFGVVLSIAVMFISGPFVALGGGGGGSQRAIERVMDIEVYKADILGRVAFWELLVRKGLSSPLFGHGMASFDIGTEGGTSFHVGSAHNVLVSTFYTSGIIGLMIMLLLWHQAFLGIYRLRVNSPKDAWFARFLVISIMVLLLISVTNDLTAGRGNLLMMLFALMTGHLTSTINKFDELNRNTEINPKTCLIQRKSRG